MYQFTQEELTLRRPKWYWLPAKRFAWRSEQELQYNHTWQESRSNTEGQYQSRISSSNTALIPVMAIGDLLYVKKDSSSSSG